MLVLLFGKREKILFKKIEVSPSLQANWASPPPLSRTRAGHSPATAHPSPSLFLSLTCGSHSVTSPLTSCVFNLQPLNASVTCEKSAARFRRLKPGLLAFFTPISSPRPPPSFPSHSSSNRAPRLQIFHAGAAIAAGKKLEFRSPCLTPISPSYPIFFAASLGLSLNYFGIFHAAGHPR